MVATTTRCLAVSANGYTRVELHDERLVDKHTLMTKDKATANGALKELDVLLTIQQSPYITKLHGYRLEGERLHVLEEYCERGDLFRVAQLESRMLQAGLLDAENGLTTTEQGLQRVFQQICAGVAHLHAHNIAHGDLSLENVLVTAKGDAKLTDFALSTRFQRDAATGRVVHVAPSSVEMAKTAYAAPELHTGDAMDVTMADAWAVGVMLWNLYTRTPLLQSATPDDALFRVMTARGSWCALEQTQRLRRASWALRDLLHRLLDPNPDTRLSVTEAQHHLWFRTASVVAKSSSVGLHKNPPQLKRMRSRSSGCEIALDATRLSIRSSLVSR